MGGMGVWEVAAQRPDLFAAIAPVAGHHKKEKSQWIAERLSASSIRVLHDVTDGTCPIASEETLWKLFKANGHKDFHIVLTSGVGHCNMYEHVYCITLDLYLWFLQRGAVTQCQEADRSAMWGITAPDESREVGISVPKTCFQPTNDGREKHTLCQDPH